MDQPSKKPTLKSDLSVWLDYLGKLHVSAIDLGLSRVLPVAKLLGVIQPKAYVFTVAGTNGKGSTTQTIASICHKAGYKTALYQSPHVFKFNERISINGQYASDDQLIDAFFRVEQARVTANVSLSFFEATTLAALLIFRDTGCDVWVLEVGLGGRLDVVNIIDPDVAIITNIGIDHVQWLGTNIEQIGREKAGILRSGIDCILASTMPSSVIQVAQDLDCRVIQAGAHYQFRARETDWLYTNSAFTLSLPKPSIALANAAAGITAILASELKVTGQVLNDAMPSLSMIGRHQFLRWRDREVVMDAAHNQQGAQFLVNYLIQHHHANNRQLHVVFSMLADKAVFEVITIIWRAFPTARWHVSAINTPRAASTADLEEIFLSVEKHHSSKIYRQYYDDLSKASQGAYQQGTASDMILVCGSFHALAESGIMSS